MRLALVLCVACACLSVAASVFWVEDLRYSRPTPRPSTLVQPPRGAPLAVERWLTAAGIRRDGRPVLLHFFNPSCPCTRFNVEHARRLRARFGERVRFVAVAQSPLEGDELRRATDALGLGLPWIADPAGRIAAEAGVYSTPQAVLVGADGKLAYRGNYNLSRYCTDPATEFVRIALEALVEGGPLPPDTPAYGCELPRASRLLAEGGPRVQ